MQSRDKLPLGGIISFFLNNLKRVILSPRDFGKIQSPSRAFPATHSWIISQSTYRQVDWNHLH